MRKISYSICRHYKRLLVDRDIFYTSDYHLQKLYARFRTAAIGSQKIFKSRVVRFLSRTHARVHIYTRAGNAFFSERALAYILYTALSRLFSLSLSLAGPVCWYISLSRTLGFLTFSFQLYKRVYRARTHTHTHDTRGIIHNCSFDVRQRRQRRGVCIRVVRIR